MEKKLTSPKSYPAPLPPDPAPAPYPHLTLGYDPSFINAEVT